MRSLPRLLAFSILSAASDLSSPLSAQQLAVRSDFEVLRDSLAISSDTALLRAKVKMIRGSAALPSQIRAGLLALRLGELRADPDFSDARSTFRRATRLHPERPEPWFGLALTEAARSQ